MGMFGDGAEDGRHFVDGQPWPLRGLKSGSTMVFYHMFPMRLPRLRVAELCNQGTHSIVLPHGMTCNLKRSIVGIRSKLVQVQTCLTRIVILKIRMIGPFRKYSLKQV